jgi:CelD/BcsL family acetyltransferase involved in cellulose biosynthesis
MDFDLLQTLPENLQGEWNALLDESVTHVPFLRYEYLNIWWKTRGGGEWPDAKLELVTARRDGRLVGAAPLFYTPNHYDRPSLLLLGSIEISDYLDLLVRPEDLDQFVNELLPCLEVMPGPYWEALDLYNIIENSPTVEALKQAARRQIRPISVERLQHSPYIPLPGDWEAYLAGIDKKQRHEIRRKMRRAGELGLPVRWYIVEDQHTLDSEIEALFDLMAQDADKAAFLTPTMRAQMKETIRCAFDAKCLNLAFLEIGSEKAAAYLSFDYLNRLWIYNSGLNRKFNDYSPGWVLLGYLLQWANQQKFTEFDFMRGDEEYKYRFGAIDRFVVRVTIGRSTAG